jgi:hypothetical protein
VINKNKNNKYEKVTDNFSGGFLLV